MSVVAFIGLVSVIFDLCTYGASTKGSTLVALIDSLNFCISYRATTQVLRVHQRWFSLVCISIFLKRVAGWLSAICLGIVPSFRDDLAPIFIVIIALILIQKTPQDFAYKDMRLPATKAILSIGGAIFRWRKLLLVAHMFRYSIVSWKAFFVVSLVVDGSSAAKNVDYWWVLSWHKGSVQIGSTVRDLASFACKRVLPTWFFFIVLAHMPSSESSSWSTGLVENVGVWTAFLFYLHSFSVFAQLRSLATDYRPVKKEASASSTKKKSLKKSVEDVATTDCSGSDSSECQNVAQVEKCRKRKSSKNNNNNCAAATDEQNDNAAAGAAEPKEKTQS